LKEANQRLHNPRVLAISMTQAHGFDGCRELGSEWPEILEAHDVGRKSLGIKA
jgi:hypothetical protein